MLARLFSYADAHRARMGVNYKQVPVNRPQVPIHSYSKDGVMRVENVSDPVYAPNSKGGSAADPEQWAASGDFIHAAYTLRKDDDDWGRAGTLVRKVMDDAARSRLISNVVGHLKKGVSAPVLKRALEYWRNIDGNIGEHIAKGMHDFIDPKLKRAVPYGVYDLNNNVGWVSVGTDHDAACFAVNTIRRWWRSWGRGDILALNV